jgi:hypothetical protein
LDKYKNVLMKTKRWTSLLAISNCLQ